MGKKQVKNVYLVILFTLFFFTVVQATLDIEDTTSIVCRCRCCYQGGCSFMPNISWVVSSCDECSTAICNAHIRSKEVRMKTARLFEGIESDRPSFDTDGRIHECKVISVLEAATFLSKNYKRTTTIKAECFSRDAPLIKYSIIAFLGVTTVAIIVGLVKNHIPAFHRLNEKYFDY